MEKCSNLKTMVLLQDFQIYKLKQQSFLTFTLLFMEEVGIIITTFIILILNGL